MRKTKTIGTDRIHHRNDLTPRLIVVWAVFVLSAAAVFLWARAENQRIVSEYQQSANCNRPGQQNCREILDAVVDQIYPIYGSIMPSRVGGRTDHTRQVSSFDLDIFLSDGSKTTARLSKEKMFQPELETDAFVGYPDVYRLEEAQKGNTLTVTRWRNKIITVRLPGSKVDVYTIDHPLNDWNMRFLPLRSIFSLLLIAVLIWTGYEILRKQG